MPPRSARRVVVEVRPGWDFDRLVLGMTLDEYCVPMLYRAPHQYAHDPIPRADAFIDAFPPEPPRTVG